MYGRTHARTRGLVSRPKTSDCSGRILHSTLDQIAETVAGEHTSDPHTRSIEQTNSSASHFRPPKSRFWPSEAVRTKSDSSVHLRRPISTLPPPFATIRDRRRVDRPVTDIHVDRWTDRQREVGVPKRSCIIV